MSDVQRRPAQVFHISEFICEELLERGWTTEDVARRMFSSREFWRDLITVDLLLCVHSDRLLLDDETCNGLARAFGVSPEFFRNLDKEWRDFPDRRSPYTPPEDVFGPISRAMISAPREDQPNE